MLAWRQLRFSRVGARGSASAATQGDGRRSSKRTASKPVPSRTEEEDDDEEGGVLRADTGMAYQTQFNAMKMLIANDEPWMFALDVEARGDCWVMAMLACAPLSTLARYS